MGAVVDFAEVVAAGLGAVAQESSEKRREWGEGGRKWEGDNRGEIMRTVKNNVQYSTPCRSDAFLFIRHQD